VLIAPCFPLLEDWARANHIVFSSREALIREVRVRELYEGFVAELNRDLARFEQLKKVVLIGEEFSGENGLLTATMKVRRSTVEERYRRQIEETYA